MVESLLTDEQRDLVERFGVLHDSLGFSPAPGRVLGLLLVSPEPGLTFEEIRSSLSLSKSSTSAAVNFLLNIGSVEYFTRSGERKRYFRKSYSNWEAALIQRMDAFLSQRELLREAHELNSHLPARSGSEIPRMIEFLEFLEDTVHEAYDRWVAERGASKPATTSESDRPPAATAQRSTDGPK